MSELQTYTFWQLATEYKIEIPIIQRDYAQGRSDDKSKEIREFFLSEIFNVLLSQEETLNLDFVYGKIDENIFIPIDGQQRLTTLYLLHWYLATKFNQDFKVIKGFTYRTRFSSRDFCKKLTDSTFNFIELEKGYKNLLVNDKCNSTTDSFLTFEIKNCEWYLLSWDTDPTVQSMLNTLDSIHSKFKDLPEDLWLKLIEPISIMHSENIKLNKLITTIENLHDENVDLALEDFKKKPPITFKFLNLKDFKLSDELYLKMNGRGRALSEFEKFKAWFFGHADSFLSENKENVSYTNDSNLSNIITENWKDLFDGIWTDWVWNKSIDNKIIKSEFFDRSMISLIKNIAFINYFENYVNKDAKEFKDVYENYLKIDNITSFLKGIYLLCFKTKDNIKFLLNAFQILSIKLKNLEDTSLFPSKWVNDNNKFSDNLFGSMSFKEKSILYATVKFYENDINRIGFNDWFRIIRNLVENTEIAAHNFTEILKSIMKLATHNCFQEIIKETAFKNEQKEEEIFKNNLLSLKKEDGVEWEYDIMDAENHPLFRGNISFLFPKHEEPELQKFNCRKTVALNLFNEKGINFKQNTNLFGRVLLANGLDLKNDILLWLGGRSVQYWKDHLKDSHYVPSIQITIDLLIDIPPEKYENTLQSYLESISITNFPIWKTNLIEAPELFRDYSSYGKISKDWRGIYLYEKEKFCEKSNGIFLDSVRNNIITNFLILYNLKVSDENNIINMKYFTGKNIDLENEKIKFIFENESFKVYIKPEKLICEDEFLYLNYSNDVFITLFNLKYLNYLN